jgi:hypothetical protein
MRFLGVFVALISSLVPVLGDKPECVRVVHPDQYHVVYGLEEVRVATNTNLAGRLHVAVSYLGQTLPVTRTGETTFQFEAFRHLDVHTVSATLRYVDQDGAHRSCTDRVTTAQARPPDATAQNRILSFTLTQETVDSLRGPDGSLNPDAIRAHLDGQPVPLRDLHLAGSRSGRQVIFVYYDISASMFTTGLAYGGDLVGTLKTLRREYRELVQRQGSQVEVRLIPFVERPMVSPHQRQTFDQAIDLVAEIQVKRKLLGGSPICRVMRQALDAATAHERLHHDEQASVVFVSDFFDQDPVTDGCTNMKACTSLQRTVASYPVNLHGVRVVGEQSIAARRVIEAGGGFLEQSVFHGLLRIIRSYMVEATLSDASAGGVVKIVLTSGAPRTDEDIKAEETSKRVLYRGELSPYRLSSSVTGKAAAALEAFEVRLAQRLRGAAARIERAVETIPGGPERSQSPSSSVRVRHLNALKAYRRALTECVDQEEGLAVPLAEVEARIGLADERADRLLRRHLRTSSSEYLRSRAVLTEAVARAARHLLHCPLGTDSPGDRRVCRREALRFAQSVVPRAHKLLAGHDAWKPIRGLLAGYCSDGFPGSKRVREALAPYLCE